MKTPRLHNFLALVLALFTTVSLCAPGFACAANVTTGDIADASAAEPVEEERIAEDYDALEGEVHNTIDVSEADEEILPDDSLTTFATYDYDTELAKFPTAPCSPSCTRPIPSGSSWPMKPAWISKLLSPTRRIPAKMSSAPASAAV